MKKLLSFVALITYCGTSFAVPETITYLEMRCAKPKQGITGAAGDPGPTGPTGPQGAEALITMSSAYGNFYLIPDEGSLPLNDSDPVPFNHSTISFNVNLFTPDTITFALAGDYLVTFAVSPAISTVMKLTLNGVDIPGSYTSIDPGGVGGEDFFYNPISVMFNVSTPGSTLQLINAFGATILESQTQNEVDSAAYIVVVKIDS